MTAIFVPRPSLLVIISLSKAWRVGELLSPMFADCDGHAANAEHQRQQRQHRKVENVSLHRGHAWFAMPAMFGASAAEVRWQLISSHNSGGLQVANLHLRHQPSFNIRIFAIYLSGNWSGVPTSHLGHLPKCREHPNTRCAWAGGTTEFLCELQLQILLILCFPTYAIFMRIIIGFSMGRY